MQYRYGSRAAAFALGLFIALPVMGNPAPSNEELYQIIRQLQAQIEALKRQVAGQQPPAAPKQRALEQQVQEQQKQIEALADEAAQARQQQTASKTKLSGYGELHYNNLEAKGGVNPSARDREEVDFHRFVLFFGHDFSDRVRFFSELEVEHALVRDTDTDTDRSCVVNDADADGVLEPGEVTCGTPSTNPRAGTGEVELEQAYLEFDLNNTWKAKGGLFLIPVGILNETHEPPSFFGVERNPVENAIIPSTWWAGGAGLTAQWGQGWSADVAVHEGLNTNVGARYAVRSGRQKTSSARAEDLAATARLKWTGIPGFEWAATYHHQADITQSRDLNAGSASLMETHLIWNRGAFGVRALYAAWDLDGNGPELLGADQQEGYYLEPSWRFSPNWGVFARYNVWDNQAGSGVAPADPGDTEKQQTDLGINWWPLQNVVVKADYQMQDNENEQDLEGFNLGIGYQF
ncbi:MAG: porin [Nevskiales bacterium]